MTGTQRLTEDLYPQLQRTLRQGARASRLLRFTPEMIELLYPAAAHPHMNAFDRAIKVEATIRNATEAIGGNPGHAIATVLCLPPGTVGRKLKDRRRAAAQQLDIQAETFRRHWHEGALLYDLTLEIYRLHTTNTPETNTSDSVSCSPASKGGTARRGI